MTNKKPSPPNEKPQQSSENSEAISENKADTKGGTKKPEKEIGGYEDAGLAEPTRFGDWEVKGRCSDF
ncbi:MAG: DUF1674 domain-containing protein [Pseudomonadota bacterium]